MPLIETKGAASAQGYGEFTASAPKVYIEDVFSTYLYTGNGSTQTITNGIDLSTKGGLVWTKSRSNITFHDLEDTVRGAGNSIYSNSTNASDYSASRITAFNSNGYSLGSVEPNVNNYTYASWTFRKQPKFFDVVTYTGTGTTRTVSHNLGSVPGMIIVKRTDAAVGWITYHRSLGADKIVYLNTTDASATSTSAWGNTSPTSTEFTVGTNANNIAGGTFVAYLFAHDAGGFGLSGTDNVISCGSYTGNGATGGQLINLGYEAQWVMIKQTNASGSGWWMMDTMRGWTVNGDFGSDANLYANTSGAESNQVLGQPDAQGFRPIQDNVNQSGQTYIYIAIRRGPMKVPTSGTSVYQGTTRSGTGAAASISGLAFPPDAVLTRNRDSNSSSRYAMYDKLRGPTIYLDTAATDSEFTVAQSLTSFNQTGESFGTGAISNANAEPYINWQFRRAPGFFDVVCYTGNDVARTVSHNLGAVPELIIVKARNNGTGWCCYAASLGNTTRIYLNQTGSATSGVSSWNSTTPTSSVFSLLGPGDVNQSGYNYVAYLFATVAGVSKVGSYTGSGTTKQIDCGFTGGARFVLIKRTDSTGDWYVYDSARGIVSGDDPYLLINSTAAEVTNTDYVDTYSAGFELSSTAPAGLNANGGTYIFLAIA